MAIQKSDSLIKASVLKSVYSELSSSISTAADNINDGEIKLTKTINGVTSSIGNGEFSVNQKNNQTIDITTSKEEIISSLEYTPADKTEAIYAIDDSTTTFKYSSEDVVTKVNDLTQIALHVDSTGAKTGDIPLIQADQLRSDDQGNSYSSADITIIKNRADKLSNPNLLDNPWFTVNQRSVASASVDAQAYFVDRWVAKRVQYTVSADGITVKGLNTGTWGIVQYLESSVDIKSKTLTFSVKDGNGVVTYAVLDVDTNGDSQNKTISVGSVQMTCSVHVSGTSYGVYLQKDASAETISIRAMKLEQGSISTLVNDSAPDYATELVKCQRYFQRINNSGFFGYIAATTVIGFNPVFTVPMRSTPSLTSLSAEGTSDRAFAFAQTTAGNKAFGTSTQTLTISAGSNTSPIVSLTLGTAMSSVTTSTPCYLRLTGNIDFSADL